MNMLDESQHTKYVLKAFDWDFLSLSPVVQINVLLMISEKAFSGKSYVLIEVEKCIF